MSSTLSDTYHVQLNTRKRLHPPLIKPGEPELYYAGADPRWPCEDAAGQFRRRHWFDPRSSTPGQCQWCGWVSQETKHMVRL